MDQSVIEEIGKAARGCWAILMGNRADAIHIDGSAAAVVTSFIPLLIALAVQASLGVPMPQGFIGPPTLSLLLHLLLTSVAGFAGVYSYLRARGSHTTTDLGQYIAAHNWASFFFLVASLLFGLLLPVVAGIVMLVASLVFFVRAADYLIDVRGTDLILLIGAQFLVMMMAGVVIIVLGALIPGIGFQVVG